MPNNLIRQKSRIDWMNLSGRARMTAFAAIFVVAGIAVVLVSRASGAPVAFEAEDGTMANCAQSATASGASGGSVLKFGTAAGCATADDAPGADLPISYSLASLGGTVRYVATGGSDTSGTGTVGAPYATVAKAITASATGDSIVIRGGTYRQGVLSIPASKTLKIMAYPGETPVFNGAQAVSGGWTTDGANKYIAYTPQPVLDGGGITFSTGVNLTGDFVGKYPDEAWIGTTQLKQVTNQSELADGKFWVDQTNSRIYLTAADATKSDIEVTNRTTFMDILSNGTDVEGLKVMRFASNGSSSGSAGFGSTMRVNGAAHVTLRNIDISDSAYVALSISGSNNSTFADGALFSHLTISTSNWMGVGVNYTNNLTLDGVKITNMNQFGEFAVSPASGAMKTSRTWYTTIKNSYIADNNSKGLWFDQSNWKATVANNQILDNADSGVFYEISDNLLLINNYIRSSGASRGLKAAGSSGLKIINNTFVGGSSPLNIYADNRSRAGCADPANAVCANSLSSDRDTLRPHQATIDWMPRIDMMINNIVAYPTGNTGCGPACITLFNNTNNVQLTLDSVLHKADTARGIPQTVMNGDVLANGTGSILGINRANGSGTAAYTSFATFTTVMADLPVDIDGLEATGSKSGNSWVNTDGSPTAALSAKHNEAVAIPADAIINLYIPAGTKHYGVTFK